MVLIALVLPNAQADPVPPPTITQILPNGGPTNGGTIVTISGTGFESGATVYFGAASALSINVQSDTTLTAVTAGALSSQDSVTVSNADGQSASLPQGFTYSIQPIYNWTTIAGVAANGSVNGTNTSARFILPIAVASDSAGNLYVANNGDNTIRKLTRIGGDLVSSAIAGTPGVSGGADGIGSAALFNNPNGIAVDSAGNVYVADTSNRTIRKLTPSGANWISSTIAGVAGTFGSAEGTNGTIKFSNPNGLVLDAQGNLYITDQSAIRKLTLVDTNWISSTIAGGNFGAADGTNTSIQFSQPVGMAFDAGGNLYVADTSADTIRKLTLSGTNWVSSTIAGLPNTHGSADGTNNAALFSVPTGLAIDANTNIYIADTVNSTIRLLTPSGTNWLSRTLAGEPGVNGSVDGANNAALFFRPDAITQDALGNLIVADTFNNTIRQLTLAGTNWITTTIAGQAGSAGGTDGTNNVALFEDPSGIAVDNAGNVYVANSGFNTIRKLTPVQTNWVSTTIAGQSLVSGSTEGTNTAATFRFPQGITVDSVGNVYVADVNNDTIRKLVVAGTNYVSSTIGGQAGFGGLPPQLDFPVGVAVDNSGNVYVADTDNSVIQKLGFQGGSSYSHSVIAGAAEITGSADGTGTAIRFKVPEGIAVDARTNLYVADTENHTIRKLAPTNSTWISTTIAGLAGLPGSVDGTNSTTRFLDPGAVAVDSQTNLYVLDTGNFTVRKLTPVGTNWISTTIGGLPGFYGSADGTNNNARFANANAIAVDTAGNVYVADSRNNTVRMAAFTPAMKLMPTITWANPAPLDYGIPLDATQLNAFANVLGTFSYDPPAGTILNPGTNLLSVTFTPTDLTNIAVTISTVTQLVNPFPPLITLTPANPKILLSNNVTLTASVFGPGPFIYQWQFRGANLANNFITTFAGNGTTSPVNDGSAATNAGLSAPNGVALDTLGNLFIADTSNHRIRKVTPNNLISTVAGNGNFGFSGDGGPATNANLFRPAGVAVDALGNLYIADTSNNRIRKVDANGVITTFAGSATAAFSGDGGSATSAGLSSPKSVAVDTSGNVFIADTSHGSIRKVNPSGIIFTVAGTGANAAFSGDGGPATNAALASPAGVTVDPLDNLFIADTSDNRIRKVDTNGLITTFAGNGQPTFGGDGGAATNASLKAPSSVSVDRLGNVFIADSSNLRIREVTTNGLILTLAGNGASPSFSGDGGRATNAALFAPLGIVVDSSDNVFLADTGNNRVREVFTATTLTLSNLNASAAGAYDLIVSSPYGVTTNTVNLIVGLPPLTASFTNANKLQLQLTGIAGKSYILQAATNLTPPVTWKSIATNTAKINGAASFSDTNTLANPNRYYRVTVP